MRIVLAAVALCVAAFSEEVKPSSWTDAKTSLTWAASDNGLAVSRSQAVEYCRVLNLNGHRDWRLPEIDELQTLFGGSPNDRGYRLIGPLKLAGWAWSATVGKERGQSWALDLGDGARASVADGDAGLNRALCVRGARKP